MFRPSCTRSCASSPDNCFFVKSFLMQVCTSTSTSVFLSFSSRRIHHHCPCNSFVPYSVQSSISTSSFLLRPTSSLVLSSIFTAHDTQRFVQDPNVACRWTCARPSQNLASTCGDSKCRVDAHEINTCLYMTMT